MKKLLLISLVLASLTAKSQTNISKTEKTPKIDFDLSTIDTEKNISVFSGNVNYKDSIVDIKNAQQLTLDYNTNELTSIGSSDVSIDGTITIVVSENCRQNTINYMLGSRRIYINKNCE